MDIRNAVRRRVCDEQPWSGIEHAVLRREGEDGFSLSREKQRNDPASSVNSENPPQALPVINIERQMADLA